MKCHPNSIECVFTRNVLIFFFLFLQNSFENTFSSESALIQHNSLFIIHYDVIVLVSFELLCKTIEFFHCSKYEYGQEFDFKTNQHTVRT